MTQRNAAVTADEPTPRFRDFEMTASSIMNPNARPTFCHVSFCIPELGGESIFLGLRARDACTWPYGGGRSKGEQIACHLRYVLWLLSYDSGYRDRTLTGTAILNMRLVANREGSPEFSSTRICDAIVRREQNCRMAPVKAGPRLCTVACHSLGSHCLHIVRFT